MIRRAQVLTLRWRCPQTRAVHYTVRRVGEPETADCRYKFYDASAHPLSPWHDIPLHSTSPSLYNFINEIPRGTSAKLEVATSELLNPIQQDIKHGKPRFYPWPSIVNYGCFPQTWEDPNHIDLSTGYGGDNDPLDVVEIGSTIARIGDIYPVKVLGVLAMIDEEETDWKVIAINASDPLASQLNEISDLEKIPSLATMVSRIHDWFRDYKIPEGKPPSEFAFNGQAQSSEYALNVIEQTHQSWRQLRYQKGTSKLWIG